MPSPEEQAADDQASKRNPAQIVWERSIHSSHTL